ncbi:hypothetical protein [Actinomadura hibisca]|uniref:hypothetical protein n=1 Tax=Actinomadura hibisca TaxID=68565 RepID=UPI000834168C|nr:hypothetical protein [Actinomadura hibisca]
MRIRRTGTAPQVCADLQRHHLDRLSWALVEAGWAVSFRSADLIPLMRVVQPAFPLVGESVTVHAHRWRLWFHDSSGRAIAPVSDLRRAVAGIGVSLAPCRPAASRRDAA